MIDSMPGWARTAVVSWMLIISLGFSERVMAQSAVGEMGRFEEEAVQRLQEYIRINTINP